MALAAVLNPLDETEALVFYYSSNNGGYNLALQNIPLGPRAVNAYINRNTINEPFPKPLSDLAVTKFLGQIRVFGFTNIPTTANGTATANVVTQLSPVINPIDDVANEIIHPGVYLSIATCGSQKDEGYIFFFKYIKDGPKLVQYNVKRGAANPDDFNINPDPSSKLAAILVGSQPWVIFQAKGATTFTYFNTRNTESHAIDTATSATAGTRFAALYSKHHDVRTVYYPTASGNIARVFSFDDKEWSQEELLFADKTIDKDSALALISDATGIYVLFWKDQDIGLKLNDWPKKS